jgi:hypothetical protein
MELVILVGLQAAGKSSFYQARFAGRHTLISKDRLRNSRNRQAQQMALIEQALRRGESVVVDNTNPRIEDRLPLIALGRRLARGSSATGSQPACPNAFAATPCARAAPECLTSRFTRLRASSNIRSVPRGSTPFSGSGSPSADSKAPGSPHRRTHYVA